MKILIPVILLFLLHAACCREPDIILTGDVILDDLYDKQEITGGVTVDCSMYKNQAINKVFLNGMEHTGGKILDLTGSGYYRIEVFFADQGSGSSEVLRIVVIDGETGRS